MPDDTSPLNVDGKVVVKILQNGLEAAIIVSPHSGEGKIPNIEMVKKELNKAGVIFGIDETVINEVISREDFEKEVVVAHGIPAIDGKDSDVKYLFETSLTVKPQEDEKGNVDYKNINLLQNVSKGQKIAELIPPVPGKEGQSVAGKKLIPRPGVVRKLPGGINTEISPDNPNILIASTEGNVYLKGGTIVQVDPVFTVTGHVDFNTGNIDYVGALVIKGDVKAGFIVKSQSDLEIQGLVEDATIICGSNVLIKNGFLGKGVGKIEADGDVMLKYCENQTITAKGDVIVGEYVMNSKIISDSKVEVSGKKGSIVGGAVSGKKGVKVRELGNYQEQTTDIIVGIDEVLIKKLEENTQELVKNDDNLGNIKKAIYKLIKLKMATKSLPKEQENLLNKLQNLQSVLPAQRQQLETQKTEIEAEMKKFENASIDVESKVYRGVRLQITKYKKNILDEMGKVTFRIIDAEIQAEK